MKKLGITFIIATCIVALGAAVVQAAVVSTFDTGAEGWSGANDFKDFKWDSSGQYIKATDVGDGRTWYFTSPSKFHGNLSAYIGGSLSYDIYLEYKSGSYWDDSEVVITGAGQTIYWNDATNHNLPYSPSDWVTYSVALTPGNFEYKSGSNYLPVTQVMFSGVMANVTALWIRGEYIYGGDRERLDNVLLTAAPLPGGLLLLGASLLPLIGFRRLTS